MVLLLLQSRNASVMVLQAFMKNDITKKLFHDIELLNTKALVKEVEKVFDASHPDFHELEKAKKILKEHEQALIDAMLGLLMHLMVKVVINIYIHSVLYLCVCCR